MLPQGVSLLASPPSLLYPPSMLIRRRYHRRFRYARYRHPSGRPCSDQPDLSLPQIYEQKKIGAKSKIGAKIKIDAKSNRALQYSMLVALVFCLLLILAGFCIF
jgi:hypothetical protein